MKSSLGFLPVVLSLYGFFVFMNTFYGIVKSIDEYFCFEGRDGPISYAETFSGVMQISLGGKSILFDEAPYLYKGAQGKEVSVSHLVMSGLCLGNVSIYDSEKIDLLDPIGELGKRFSFTFKDGDYPGTNFYVSVETLSSGPGLQASSVNFGTNERKGHPVSTPAWGGLLFYNDTKCQLWVTVTANPKICTISKRTNDIYSILGLFIFLSITTVYLCCIPPSKTMFLLRKVKNITKLLQPEFSDSIKFCNEISHSPVGFSPGDEFCSLSPEADPKLLSMEQISYFYCQNLKVSVSGLKVHVKTSDGELVNLSLRDYSVSKEIKCYLKLISINEKFCCVDKEMGHFLSTVDIIKKVNSGEHLKIFKAEGSFLGLGNINLQLGARGTAIFEQMKNSFCLKKEMVGKLIKHNFLFFPEGHDGALLKAISGKTDHTQRPAGIGNRQWKLYASDVSEIFKSENLKIYCPVPLKKSEACSRVLENEIEITDLYNFEEEIEVIVSTPNSYINGTKTHSSNSEKSEPRNDLKLELIERGKTSIAQIFEGAESIRKSLNISLDHTECGPESYFFGGNSRFISDTPTLRELILRMEKLVIGEYPKALEGMCKLDPSIERNYKSAIAIQNDIYMKSKEKKKKFSEIFPDLKFNKKLPPLEILYEKEIREMDAKRVENSRERLDSLIKIKRGVSTVMCLIDEGVVKLGEEGSYLWDEGNEKDCPDVEIDGNETDVKIKLKLSEMIKVTQKETLRFHNSENTKLKGQKCLKNQVYDCCNIIETLSESAKPCFFKYSKKRDTGRCNRKFSKMIKNLVFEKLKKFRENMLKGKNKEDKTLKKENPEVNYLAVIFKAKSLVDKIERIVEMEERGIVRMKNKKKNEEKMKEKIEGKMVNQEWN